MNVESEEKRRFVWWQFWNLSFKNSISSITVQDGCIFQGYHNNDFSGTPLIIRAVGNIRHVDLIDAEFNYFNNNLESYECRCWNDGHKISFQTCDWLVSIFPGLSLVETKTVPIPRSKNWLLLTCILR